MIKMKAHLIEGRVFVAPSHISLDTGAMVNVISLGILRKVHPGVILIEQTHYAFQGVTRSQLKIIGKKHVNHNLGSLSTV